MMGALLGLVGCTEQKGAGSEAGSSEATTAPRGSTGVGLGTTGALEDPEAYCAQFESADACTHEDEDGPFCEWVGVRPVQLEAGECRVEEPVFACRPMTGGTTAGGCAPQPDGCAEVFFRRTASGMEIFEKCGGSSVVDFEPCTYVAPFEYEPAECGCVCPGGGGSDEA